jgi:acyl-CoA thioesterase-1
VLLIGDSISIGYTLDVPQYNTVAREVMRRHAIPINDLYEAVRPRLGELQIPDTVHFQREGSRFLAERVAEAIRQALGAP